MLPISLMKGDEVVEISHERSNLMLLLPRWKPDWSLLSSLNRIGSDRSDTCRFVDEALDCFSSEAVIKELAVNCVLVLEPDDISIFEKNRVFAGHEPWNAYRPNTSYKQVTDRDFPRLCRVLSIHRFRDEERVFNRLVLGERDKVASS